MTLLPPIKIKIIKILPFLVMPLLASCLSFRQSDDNKSVTTFSLDTLKLYDQNRQREIPIAIYHPKIDISGKQKIVIFSHGYGQNKGGDYLAYSYLAEFLASKGYFVVSIQHELATDSLLPLTGNPQILRRPFWERGADNILFVVNELKKTNPDLDYKHITLIGHSNGGDMTALFPQKYPNVVEKIITLDNRRMALPKTKKVKVYSLRSSDQPADDGVLPTEKEIKKNKMKIIIIGGVAGGMSAAARLRRLDEKSDIIVIEKSGYVSFANCGLPYYIGGVIKEKDSLLLEFVQTAIKNDAVVKLIKEEFHRIEVVRGGSVGIESISMMER